MLQLDDPNLKLYRYNSNDCPLLTYIPLMPALLQPGSKLKNYKHLLVTSVINRDTYLISNIRVRVYYLLTR